jgi:hypothetical protein
LFFYFLLKLLSSLYLYLFSHHKRAAAELLPLENNPTHGILPAEDYIPAKLNSLFSVDAYRAFDIGRNVGKVRIYFSLHFVNIKS